MISHKPISGDGSARARLRGAVGHVNIKSGARALAHFRVSLLKDPTPAGMETNQMTCVAMLSP